MRSFLLSQKHELGTIPTRIGSGDIALFHQNWRFIISELKYEGFVGIIQVTPTAEDGLDNRYQATSINLDTL